MDFNAFVSGTTNSIQRSSKRYSGSDPSSDSHDPALRDVSRNRHIFPGGFGNPDQSKNLPLEFTLPQLEDILVKQHSPGDHVEHIYMKRAQYCKEYGKSQNEFIIITVETSEDPRFRNFLVLDRTTGSAPASGVDRELVPMISLSVLTSKSKDRIRVSYDGTLKPLLTHGGFSKYTVLETLEFQKMSFRLYEMVSLSRATSETRQSYLTLSSSSQWYTSLVWDCTRQLVPSATYTQNSETRFRGKFNNLFRQRIDFKELATISDSVGLELNSLRQQFVESQRKQRQDSTFLPELKRNEHFQTELSEVRD
ncbi:hypothetical protein FRC08_001273 [Ceratobasidium sp. 394]|nr:hypothetical protein FRC08_001273 [Ceratobasidium sp. 394]KAG9089043.1 hypothetical protein FS749_001665 [Ceratobasidium sp. UAMH 11750]